MLVDANRLVGHHLATLPSATHGLVNAGVKYGSAASYVLGGHEACANVPGDGNTYVSLSKMNGFGDTASSTGHMAEYRVELLDEASLPVIDAAKKSVDVTFTSNCGTDNTGKYCSAWSGITYVKLQGGGECQTATVTVTSTTAGGGMFFDVCARRGRMGTQTLQDVCTAVRSAGPAPCREGLVSSSSPMISTGVLIRARVNQKTLALTLTTLSMHHSVLALRACFSS